MRCPRCRTSFLHAELLGFAETAREEQVTPPDEEGSAEPPDDEPSPAETLAAIDLKWRRHLLAEERRKSRRFLRRYLISSALPLGVGVFFAITEKAVRWGDLCGFVVAAPLVGFVLTLAWFAAAEVWAFSVEVVFWLIGKQPSVPDLDASDEEDRPGIGGGEPSPS
ncbi:MAG TPA: hypothetical protein VKA46_16205 [Gemmataceae bacterium]|nr:hypothetical protein [Gemmataceae bacterium]